MIKKLNQTWGIFSHADIKHITPDLMAVCDMVVMSEATETEPEVETYREGLVSFDDGKWPFELTPEEIDELIYKEPVYEEDLGAGELAG